VSYDSRVRGTIGRVVVCILVAATGSATGGAAASPLSASEVVRQASASAYDSARSAELALRYVGVSESANAALCTASEKAEATRALTAFTRTMAAKRRAYFRTHTGAKARQAFAKRQKATLKRLQAAARCEVAPPPPPPAPSPPAPGAPATYVFGAEVSAGQQALVRHGLDAGARYYRAALGRELPPFAVWAYGDLEAMIHAYAESRPTSMDDARRLWEGGQVGHALTRKVWLGPRWFLNPQLSALKIAAHEAFHLLQYELVGERPLSASGLDEIPPAGPWWLAEGTAEYFAYLAVAEDGAVRFADVRAQWVQSTKASSATLRALATLRGQRENPAPYDIYALATELLLRGREPKLVFTYYDAIARGVAWPDAFAATFGRTFDAFVDDFEAFRRGL
jgi:hypothetical protein